MSRLNWAIFLAAILGLSSLLGKSNPSDERFALSVSPTLGEKLSVFGNFPPNVGGTGATQSQPKGLPQSISANTNNTLSVALYDFPVGKTIQIGDATSGLQFVKIGESQYLSIAPQCPDPVLTATGAQKLFTYTGNYQSYTFYAGCEYQIELWGAQGGSRTNTNYGGYGSYVSGSLQIGKQTNLYFYLGEHRQTSGYADNAGTSFNGGGAGATKYGYTGGGSTDIRSISGSWNIAESLRSRIAVAGGGGGENAYNDASTSYSGAFNGGNAGGLTGYVGIERRKPSCGGGNTHTVATGGTQIAGGSGGTASGISTAEKGTPGYFGQGGSISTASYGGGGGAGWYGGGGGSVTSCHVTSGAGGSSYISGHTGCIAVTSTSSSSPKSGCTTGTTDNGCSISPYGYTFTNTVMIDGAGYQWTNTKGALKPMPNPNGGNYASGVGHSGNGYARITRLN